MYLDINEGDERYGLYRLCPSSNCQLFIYGDSAGGMSKVKSQNNKGVAPPLSIDISKE